MSIEKSYIRVIFSLDKRLQLCYSEAESQSQLIETQRLSGHESQDRCKLSII